LLEREKPGPKEMKLRGVPEAVVRELRTGVESGRWATPEAARIWLQKERGIKRPYVKIWWWLKKLGGALRVSRPRHPENNQEAADKFKQELGAKLEALPLPQGSRVRVWVMDEARFGLQIEMRRVWISKGVHPEVRRQICYEWDYPYRALEVVEGRTEFLHLPTVNLDCNQLFLEYLRSSHPQAHHVVIADQADFHLSEGDARLPEGVHIVSLPPYNSELNPCERLWDLLKDTEGFSNGLFESIENLRKALRPGLQRFWDDAQAVLSLIGRPWLRSQANATAKI